MPWSRAGTLLISNHLGDPHITVADLQEGLARVILHSRTSFCISVQTCVAQLSTGIKDAESFVPLLSSWSMKSKDYLLFL